MPNPLRGEVPITLKGKERLLRFTYEAILELEGKLVLPRGVAQVFDLIGNPTLGTYQVLLLAGLRHKWTKITLADVSPSDDEPLFEWFNSVGKPIAEAMTLAFFGRKKIVADAPEGATEGAEAGTADAAPPTASATPTGSPPASDAPIASSGS